MAKILEKITKLFNSRPDEIVDKVANKMSFRADILGMLQQPPATEKIPGVPRIMGYRYPAPASREAPNVPDMPPNLHYDINRFPRDNRNVKVDSPVFLSERVKQYLETGDESMHPLIGTPPPQQGSPGNKNPAVLRYDPTGLRSSMSATWAEMNKSVEMYKPLHLPTAEWVDDYDNMVKDAEDKGIPVPIGRPVRMRMSRLMRTAHW